MTFNAIQLQKTQLYGSGVTATATSIILETLRLLDGSTNVTMTMIGDIGYGTLEPGTSSEEQISFTGITQNADGTATLTGVTRGLDSQSPYAENSDNKHSHGGATEFVISNTSGFYSEFLAARNNETISGKYTFPAANIPVYDSNPTFTPGSKELATVKYADDLAIAGAPDASTTTKGLSETSTSTEADAGAADGSGDTTAPLVITASVLQATKIGLNSKGRYMDYSADTGVADAYVVTLDPIPTSYTAGMAFDFKPGNNNTGASTINVNGLGVKSIKKDINVDLSADDLVSGKIYKLIYDGTNFQLSDVSTPVVSEDFVSSGTWTKPTNAQKVLVQVWGAGGSGAAGDTISGGGGGGGEYREAWFNASDLSATETVTVGSGGAGVAAGVAAGTTGSNGNNTTFGSHITAYGGSGGNSDGNPTNAAAGGNGGKPSGFSNSDGVWGAATTTSTGDGVYSAAGGASESGNPHVGGNSVKGGAGGGAVNNTSTSSGGTSLEGGSGGAGANNASATNGAQPGGGGGACNSSNTGHYSGAGADGKVTVTTFF